VSVELAAAPALTVGVVICCYTERRFAQLQAAVESVRCQTRPPDELVVVVDHAPALLVRARQELGDRARVVANGGQRGLADARNAGVRHLTAEVVAFLDDDAVAEERWLEQLTAWYADPDVVGTGGIVEPRWAQAPPRWLPDEFLWVVGCSYTGLPRTPAAVRNPIGANMSFRRPALAHRGFRAGVGRVGTRPMGCEETELAIRAARDRPGGRVVHVPAARVHHHVPPERAGWRYFASRCWAEGRSKAIVAGLTGTGAGLASERAYVRRTLPAGVARGLRDALGGDLSGLGRSGAIVAGLALAGAGYLRGRLLPVG
jgi:cellulose synthase/poly-beta-1,6-N-acetylglucosamine synthase-like glycosyltransferase